MYAKALKEKTMELRKARDPMATFLVSVTSKAKDFAKAEDAAATDFNDDQALRAINSYIKGAEDNIALLREAQDSPLYVRAVEERTLLKAFLPAEATDAEVRKFVAQYIAHLKAEGAELKKSIGTIMKALSDKFGAALNKKTANGIVQEEINK